MFVRVDPSAHAPIYRQVMDQVRFAVASGRLAPGAKLPGSRELAQELAVNLQTVAKAYAELAREGLVEVRRGLGTFVAAGAAPERGPGSMDGREVEAALRRLCREAGAAGWSLDELSGGLRRAWNEEVDGWTP